LAAAVLVCLALWGSGLLDGVQRWAYDHALAAAARPGSSDIVIVAIDAHSQAQRGTWPWSRELHSRLVDRLHAAGAKVVVHAEAFVEPESQRALTEWQRIATTVAADPALAHHPELPVLLSLSREQLDADGQLARSLAMQGNSLLALGALNGEKATPAAGLAGRVTAMVEADPPGAGPGGSDAIARPPWPLRRLAQAARAVGHLDLTADADGVLRRHALRREVQGQGVASLAWLAALLQRGLPVTTPPQAGERLAGLPALPQTWAADGRVAPIFAAPDLLRQPAFVRLGADAVIDGRFNARAVAGKLVLIGRVDPAVRLAGVTLPDGENAAPVEVLAHLSSALLTGQLVAQPLWARGLPWLVALVVLGHLILLAPRLTAGSGLLISGLGALCLLLAAQLGLSAQHVWVPMVLPAAMLLLGHLAVLVARRHGSLAVARPWRRPAGQAAEARPSRPAVPNAAILPTLTPITALPMASLSVGAGSRTVPLVAGGPDRADSVHQAPQVLTQTVAEAQRSRPAALLDGERPLHDTAAPAGRAHSARAVDLSLAATQPLYERARPEGPPDPISLPGSVRRLGRYEVERELGRGTMGRVYLAKDVGTGREVALKTMALAREFEGFALHDAKARFQREALAACRLEHPDIVRVLDSGEERGLVYIAMERLYGHDLAQHIRPGSLLSMRSVVVVGIRVAAALAYAHRQGVVHRDIKPANVMIDPARAQVKVTDFGIARLTDSARTRTGLVLGSPSYMSPEQLIGRPADGRSDLYSLGVVLFQMLTGQLPIQAHTLADLIQAVTREPAPDLRRLRPEAPQALADILGILLQKRPELRYADGDQLAADLRLVGALLARERRTAALPPADSGPAVSGSV
jgi:serine/threonine-protein kinase